MKTVKQHLEAANAALKANEPILANLQANLINQENELFKIGLELAEIEETQNDINNSML